jgi:hypothetical protein
MVSSAASDVYKRQLLYQHTEHDCPIAKTFND